MIGIESNYNFKELGNTLIEISKELEKNQYVFKREVRE